MASSSSTGPRKFAWKKDKTRIESILKLPLQQITVDTYDSLSKKIISGVSELELTESEPTEITMLFLQGYTSDMYCDLFAQLLKGLINCSPEILQKFQEQIISEINTDCAEDAEEDTVVKYCKRKQDLSVLVKSCLDHKIIEYSVYSGIVEILVEKMTKCTTSDLQIMFIKCIKEMSTRLNSIDFTNTVDALSPLECVHAQSVIKFTFDELLQKKPQKKTQGPGSQKEIREQFNRVNEQNIQHSQSWLVSNLIKQIETSTDKAIVYNFLNDTGLDDSTRKHIKICLTGKKANEKWGVLRDIADIARKRIKPKFDHMFTYKPVQQQRAPGDTWETVQKHKKPQQASFIDPTIQTDYLTVFLATVKDLEKRQKTKAENLAENRQLIINFIKHRHTQRSKTKQELINEINDLEKGTRVKDLLKGIEKTIKYFVADNLGVEPEVLGNEPYTSEQKELIARLIEELINIAIAD